MYSQYDEEQYILKHFGTLKEGRFLDIGAYNGLVFSNSKALVELGWSGVCIEPSPVVFPDLLTTHADNEKIICVQAALYHTTGTVKFFDSGGDAISTFVESHKKKWERNANSKFNTVAVKTITYDDILRTYGNVFDFINLDIEGLSFEFFAKMPDKMLQRASCLCIEHDNRVSQIVDRAKFYGFSKVYQSDNVILTK